MAKKKYSLLEAFRPNLSEKRYKQLLDEIKWREKVEERNKITGGEEIDGDF